MILAHHSIISFHGFWLPNDPRGSGSDYIANWELFRYGPATKVDTRHSVAHKSHDRANRLQAKETLKTPPVLITGVQAVTVAAGFAKAIEEAGYGVHACAILPDHVHLVISWHERDIRVIVGHLRSKATMALRKAGLWDDRQLWGEHGWNVRLEDIAEVERAIAYAEFNPEKEGKRRQQWSLVTQFVLDAVVARIRSQANGAKRERRIGGAALRSHQQKLRRDGHGKGR